MQYMQYIQYMHIWIENKSTFNMPNICTICTRYAQDHDIKTHTYDTYTYIPLVVNGRAGRVPVPCS